METEPNRGKKGATKQSWERDRSVRVIVGELQLQHPKAGEKRLVSLVRERCDAEPDVLDTFIEYGVRNVIAAQEGYRARQQKTPEERAKREAEIVEAAKKGAAQILLLNWRMPNDLPLRACKGDYIAKVCAPMAKAGKKAGNKLMGQVFDEKSLREFIGW